MLINRIVPLTKVTRTHFRLASTQLAFRFPVKKLPKIEIKRGPNGVSGCASLLSPKPNNTNLTLCKAFSTKQPELPSKQELEKYFFKVTVVIWDLMTTILMWSWAMLRKYIINNPTVQSYWKTFNQKLEEARKN